MTSRSTVKIVVKFGGDIYANKRNNGSEKEARENCLFLVAFLIVQSAISAEDKADITKSSADTVYRLAEALGVTMEELLAEHLEKRCDFRIVQK